jgi:hypothetical protein
MMRERDWWPTFGEQEDFVHAQMRAYWLATGQLTEEQAGRPVGADQFNDLTFLAAWGEVPTANAELVTDAGWGGPWAPVAWSTQWADWGSGSVYTAAWSAGYL